LFEARVLAREVERSRGKTAVRELPRDQGMTPREIGARLGQPQQEGQNHFAADRYVPANPVAASFGPGLSILSARAPVTDSVRRNSALRNEAQSET
jgi:hypothetical protein